MSQTEWIVQSRSVLAAVVLLTVPLATDTKSDQDQAVPSAGAAGALVPLPPEFVRYGEARSRPFLSSYRLPDTITFAGSTVPLNVWQVRERIEFEFYHFLEDEGDSIIPSKEILSQPEKYLGVAKADLYPPLATEVVTVNIKEDRRHLAAVAEEFGTYFLELKLLNPEIRKDYLPRGTHRIKIPQRPDNGCPMPCDKADEPR